MGPCRACKPPRTEPFGPGSGAPRSAPAESAEKSNNLNIFYGLIRSAFSPKEAGVHARNPLKGEPRALELTSRSQQWVRREALYSRNCPERGPRATFEPPVDLPPASSSSPSEGRRLPGVAMGSLLSVSLADSKPLDSPFPP
jgi:hypothetical protein